MGDVVVQLGHARLRAGQIAQAEAAAQRALPSVPAKALELLARADLASGRLDDARRHADAAAPTRNAQAVAWLVGAEVRTRQGDTAGALARLDEAESRARTAGIDAVYNLEALRADALARSGRPREAEAAYRREIAAFPTHLVAHANLAALLFAQGRRDEGRAAVEAMVAANPNPRARQVAVVTLEAVGDRARAARFARQPSK